MLPPVDASRYDEEYFLSACGGAEFFRLYGPEVLKPVLAYCLSRAELKPGMSVLDLGCGRGELLYHARRAGAAAAGTDYAGPALAIAARVSGCPVARCDAKALPFADASFDRVFFIGILDHLHDWELEAVFRELARVLKPGGFVVAHTCANRLYFKRWTYGVRKAAAGALRSCGLRVRDPSPPRSDEDEALHVNEHSVPGLRGFFGRIGWSALVEPRPNYKLALRRLYGETLPEGFPMRPAPRWKEALAGWVFREPLSWVLAREIFCVAEPGARGREAA